MKGYKIINSIVIITALAGMLAFSSCKKNGFYTNTDATLQFSSKLITFDTVFTSISTITKVLIVRNPYKNDIKTDIALVGGATSYFSINVDGIPARQLKDVEIPARDSIFIFIKANINPNGTNNPMLAVDTLSFTTNGNRQNVELLAFGQDAHFIIPNRLLPIGIVKNDTIYLPYRIIAEEGQNVTWRNDKPYVIYGYAVVDSDAKLTIEKGTRIHFHKDGALWIYTDGCLEVNGTKDEPVTFQGDRLDNWYDRDYNQWDGICINESNRGSKINYAVIRNADVGILAASSDKTKSSKLLITNTIIKSCQTEALWSRNYAIDASNNIFADCPQNCIFLQGGNYNFVNNTIYNAASSRQRKPSLSIRNYYDSNDVVVPADFSGTFINNIISGAAGNEFSFEKANNANFSVSFENCLLKQDSALKSPVTQSNMIMNKDPLFENIADFNFKLKSNSPCKKAGKSISWLLTDIDGVSRNSSTPSIGAYE